MEETIITETVQNEGEVPVGLDTLQCRVEDGSWADTMMQSLHELRSKNVFCDVMLVGKGGQVINAHTTVLSAASSRFQELLQKAQSKIVLNIPTIEVDVLQGMVDFVYQGTADVNHDHLAELQKFASAFCMDNLFKACDIGVSVVNDCVNSAVLSTEYVDSNNTLLPSGKNEIAETNNVQLTLQQVEDYDDDDHDHGQEAIGNVMEENNAEMSTDTQAIGLLKKTRKEMVTEKKESRINCRQSDNLEQSTATRQLHSLKHYKKFNHFCGRCKTFLDVCPSIECNPDIHKKKKRIRRTLYTCEFCGQMFSRKERYEAHCHRHKGTYPHICAHCGKGMYGLETYRIHMKQHNGENLPHVCAECGLQCTTKKGLYKHIQCMHQRLSKFKCIHCDVSFRHRSSLAVHLRTHTGAKPFVCNQCGRRFNDTTHLKVHTRTHTGEKPYRCSSCDKTFTHLNSLKNHRKLHFGGRVCNSGRGNKRAAKSTNDNKGYNTLEFNNEAVMPHATLILMDNETSEVLTDEGTFVAEEVHSIDDAVNLHGLNTGISYMMTPDGSLMPVDSDSTVTVVTSHDGQETTLSLVEDEKSHSNDVSMYS